MQISLYIKQHKSKASKKSKVHSQTCKKYVQLNKFKINCFDISLSRKSLKYAWNMETWLSRMNNDLDWWQFVELLTCLDVVNVSICTLIIKAPQHWNTNPSTNRQSVAFGKVDKSRYYLCTNTLIKYNIVIV